MGKSMLGKIGRSFVRGVDGFYYGDFASGVGTSSDRITKIRNLPNYGIAKGHVPGFGLRELAEHRPNASSNSPSWRDPPWTDLPESIKYRGRRGPRPKKFHKMMHWKERLNGTGRADSVPAYKYNAPGISPPRTYDAGGSAGSNRNMSFGGPRQAVEGASADMTNHTPFPSSFESAPGRKKTISSRSLVSHTLAGNTSGVGVSSGSVGIGSTPGPSVRGGAVDPGSFRNQSVDLGGPNPWWGEAPTPSPIETPKPQHRTRRKRRASSPLPQYGPIHQPSLLTNQAANPTPKSGAPTSAGAVGGNSAGWATAGMIGGSALAGGVTSYATGGDFTQGAMMGGLGGAGMAIGVPKLAKLAKNNPKGWSALNNETFSSSMSSIGNFSATSSGRAAMFAGGGLLGGAMFGGRRSHKRGFNQNRGNGFGH